MAFCCLILFFAYRKRAKGLARSLLWGKKIRFCVPSLKKPNNQTTKQLFSLAAASAPSDVRGLLCMCLFQQFECQVGNE